MNKSLSITLIILALTIISLPRIEKQSWQESDSLSHEKSLSNLFIPQAHAQTYNNLPKARLQSYTQNGTLPQANGLNLSGGMNRGNASAQPYNPGEPSLNMPLVRWESKKMPILIWIAPGLKLPECPFSAIPSTRVDQVFEMLGNLENLLKLEVASGWTEDTNYVVANGIEMWRPLENEGLFKFGFTDDPSKAHIVVFFTDTFKEGDSAGGISVAGITSAQLYPYDLAQRIKIAQKPVVIELSTMVNSSPERMRGASAHEFGHALGIKAHSPYREDLMFVDRIVNELSPADIVTIRGLYKHTPQYVM
jgi:hypothetical protein